MPAAAALLLSRAFNPTTLLPDMRLNTSAGYSTFDIEILDNKDAYELSAELPGFGEEDVTLEVENNVIKVTGKRSKADVYDADAIENGGNLVKTRRIWKTVERSLRIPGDVDQAAISAVIDKGILTINMPKRPETAARRIAVTNGAAPKPRLSPPPAAVVENHTAVVHSNTTVDKTNKKGQ